MLKMFAAWVLVVLTFACGTKQPKVTDEAQKNPSATIGHLGLTTGCADCHAAERPAPNEDTIVVTHGDGRACETCHTWPAFKTLNSFAKGHNPYPKSCLGCHSREGEGTSHPARGDCMNCHAFPKWLPNVYPKT